MNKEPIKAVVVGKETILMPESYMEIVIFAKDGELIKRVSQRQQIVDKPTSFYEPSIKVSLDLSLADLNDKI